MSAKALWFILVLVAVAVLVTAVVARHHRWTPDGFSYARVAMEDAGLSPGEALAAGESFYLQQPVGRNPRYRIYFTVDLAHAPPAAGPIFRTRVLYPWLASLVYRWHGIEALTDVSAAAYVLSVCAMYWLLLALARPWIAAAGALLLAISPLVLPLAESDLTDMLALALWICTLGSILYCVQQRRLWLIMTFGLSALLLALTRQAMFLPIGAVAGTFMGAYLRRDAEDTRTSVALTTVLGLVCAANAAWHVLLHGAGLGKELEITHKLSIRAGSPPDEPMFSWYRRAIIANILQEIKRAIITILPVIALVATLVERRRKETATLIGAACAGCLTIFFNPIPWDQARIFEAPLYPLIVAAVAMGAEGLLRRNYAVKAIHQPGALTPSR